MKITNTPFLVLLSLIKLSMNLNIMLATAGIFTITHHHFFSTSIQRTDCTFNLDLLYVILNIMNLKLRLVELKLHD